MLTEWLGQLLIAHLAASMHGNIKTFEQLKIVLYNIKYLIVASLLATERPPLYQSFRQACCAVDGGLYSLVTVT